MLGKGLGSLIPQKPGGAQPEPQNAPVMPAAVSSNPSPNNLTPITSAAVPAPSAQPEESIVQEPLKTENSTPVLKSVDQEALIKITPKFQDKKRDEAIFQIEVEKIVSNPHQPRRHFEESALRDLASSIREYGVLQPIIVSKIVNDSETGSTVEYELIAGERRLMASRLAGLRTVPAIIRKLTPEREKLEIAIIENIQRENLDPIEEAKAFTRLQDEFRLTQREIAAKLGKSREAVANAVRLLNLPSDVQEALSQGKISPSQGRLLLSIDDIGEQRRMFEEILKGGVSIRQMKSKILKQRDVSENSMQFVQPETLALKERLEEFLGTKVDLKDEGDKGRITINFYSKEELQGIIDKLLKDNLDQ